MPAPVSRRAVVASTLWAAPAIVVVTAAPAQAVCSSSQAGTPSSYRVDWSNSFNYRRDTNSFTGGGGTATPVTVAGAADDLTFRVASTFQGRMRAMTGPFQGYDYRNLHASTHNVGNTGSRGLILAQQRSANSGSAPHQQTFSLMFDRPVSNLKFTITDIDLASGNHRDWVGLAPAPSTRDTTLGSGIEANSGGWRAKSDSSNLNETTSTRGNLTVDYTGRPASQAYGVTFSNLGGTGGQWIFLSAMTFSASSCK